MRRLVLAGLLAAFACASPSGAGAQSSPGSQPMTAEASQNWKTVWAGSVQGPYPVGNPSAQPDQRFAFPDPARGANDQTFRLVVRPSLWGSAARIRLSNAFGTKPVTFDGVHLGLQLAAAEIVPGTNRPVRFGGAPSVTVAPGADVWSDPVDLPFAHAANLPMLDGRKLAVSLHVAGETGPMTWHAKALQTSYLGEPGSGSRGAEESEEPFPLPTASWFFLDAVDMRAPAATPVVLAFGDSISDGTASTMNGDDRWPDVLARRLGRALGPNKAAVVNAGIGGNQVVGPAAYGPDRPFPGGPSALARLDRDVIGLSGVTTVIWLEGINDFSRNGNATLAAVQDGMRQGVARLKERGIRVVGATLTSALNSSSGAHGFAGQDEKRRGLNDFIRSSGLFDAVVDFDAATLDPRSGEMKEAFVPESTTGGPGDRLHPNRTGYQAMGFAIPLSAVVPAAKP